MRKKLLILTLVGAIIAIATFHNDPLQLIANFVIGGVVPGINISLGFIPTLGIIIVLLLFMKRWASELRFEMIRRTALEMNAEKTKSELETSTIADHKERRAVIAARSLEQGISQL